MTRTSEIATLVHGSDFVLYAMFSPALNRIFEIGSLKTVQAALDNGADVNAQDEYGKTPLHYASQNHTKLDILKLLISKGADVSIGNNL